jgi:hypothetical protein
MFNLRNLNKTKKVLEDSRFTLDSKHKEIMVKFKNRKKELPKMKEEFLVLAKQYSVLKSKDSCDMSNSDIEKKFSLKKEIKKLKKEINEIENNTEVIDYYLKVGTLLHDYYDNVRSTGVSKKGFDDNVEEEKKLKKEPKENKKKIYSVIDFFNNRAKSKETNNEEKELNFKNTKMLNFVEKKESFQRANHLNDYMKLIDKTYNPKIIFNKDVNKCEDCGVEMTLYVSDGFQVCDKCGRQDSIITESDKPSYKDPPPEVSYFAYKRMNHFNECLSQFQGKESTEVPQEVLDKLFLEIKKERINNLALLKPIKIKEYLKKLKLNKYYEHIPQILFRITGIPPPNFSKQQEEKLRLMFKEIQSPWREECPKGRKNFLSYDYVLYKFMELLEIDDYKEYFPLLKDRDKRYATDKIWKGICRRLRWQFIKSI